MLKELRHSLTLTICLASLLLWTDNPSHAGHKHTLIIKAKRQHTDRSEKQKFSSSDSENDLKESQAEDDKTQDKAAPELKQENINVEVLTGGKWVHLDTSATSTETINQPLRISYHHFQKMGKTIPLNVILEKQEDQFVISNKRNKGLKSLYPSEKIPVPSGYLAIDQYSAVYPRLQPGIYSLTVTPKSKPNSKNRVELWLNVSDAPLEPPIISAIDQRLAERGDLSIKLKNIIVGDQVSLYVNGEPTKPVTIKKESELDAYLPFRAILPPGPSEITVKVNRNGKESDYSQAVSATSRSTVIMARNTRLIQNDFENRKKNRLDDPRLIDTTEFEFVNSRKSRKKRNYVTKEELADELKKLQTSLTQVIQQAQRNQDRTYFQGELDALNNKLDTLNTRLGAKDRENQILDNEVRTLKNDILTLKSCMKYVRSGWSEEPIFTWTSDKAVRESYLKARTQLETIPFLKHRVVVEKEYSDMIVDTCHQTGEFTLDITFQAMDKSKAQQQLMRIVSFSQNPTERNFTLGQFGDELVFRIRTDLRNAMQDPAGHASDKNGMENATVGSQGIHFRKAIKADAIYNLVISFYDQTLHFWLDGTKLPITQKYNSPIKAWDKNYTLILGDEFVAPNGDRKWDGGIHSFSIRNRGVDLPRPDAGVFKCLFSDVSVLSDQTVAVSFSQSAPSSATAGSDSSSRDVTEARSTGDTPNTNADTDTETEQVKLEEPALKKIEVREFAFPYPASFPVPRYHWDGHAIETEGAVLDQMRLAISKDGRYQLDFETRTTMRAEITLQLLVQLDNGQWYPLTIPKLTIVPSNYSHDLSQPADFAGTKTIKGYAPVLANRSEQIRDIRRRGNATFGTPPYINQ